MANGVANGKGPVPAQLVRERIVLVYYSEQTLADGTIVMKPLRKVVPQDEIGVAEAARLTNKSMRYIQAACDEGKIPSARKKGLYDQSHWYMSRAEVLQILA